MEQSCEEVVPTSRGWCAKVASLWQRIVAFGRYSAESCRRCRPADTLID